MNKSRKICLLFSLLSLAACQKDGRPSQVVWSLEQKTPPPALFADPEFSQTERALMVGSEVIKFSRQREHGVPVENGSLQKIEDAAGLLLYGKAHVQDTPRFSKPWQQDELERLQKTKFTFLEKLKKRSFLLNRRHTVSEPELVFVKNFGLYHLAYAVDLFDPNENQVIRSWFTPELVLLRQQIVSSDFDTQAWVYALSSKTSLQEVLLKNLLEKTELKTTTHRSVSQAPVQIQMDGSPLRFSDQDPRFDQLHAFYFVQKALDFFTRDLGLSVPVFIEVETSVGYPNATNAAFTYQNKIRLGAGDQVVYSSLARDPSIVAHEVGHVIVEQIAHLPAQGEGGSLNEAFADFFAASLLNSPRMGESAFLKGPFKRNLEDKISFAQKNGGLYHDSLIVSGFLWRVRSHLGAPLAQTLALKTLARLGPAQELKEFSQALMLAAEGHLTDDQKRLVRELLGDAGFPL